MYLGCFFAFVFFYRQETLTSDSVSVYSAIRSIDTTFVSTRVKQYTNQFITLVTYLANKNKQLYWHMPD